jgi:chromosome segregation ATPase|tara:strand:+ start:1544 stop:1885 length:342 start_codon:yes stop_codon:yes gene_type:complete
MIRKKTVSYTKYETLKSKAELWRESALELNNEKSQLEFSNESLEQQIDLLQDEILLLKERISEIEQDENESENRYRHMKKKNKELINTIETQKQTITLYGQMLSQNIMIKNNI